MRVTLVTVVALRYTQGVSPQMERDYKKVIRQRVKSAQAKRPGLTLKRLASLIPIQSTYLSRVLNDDSLHLNEDHVFAIAKLLHLDSDDTEHLCLLRNWATSGSERRPHLLAKIEKFERSRDLAVGQAEFQASQMRQDMRFLFDPMAALVLACLDIPAAQKNPQLFLSELGLSDRRFKEILRVLANSGYVELEGFRVKRILQNRVHYGLDHPLMRVHLQILKNALSARLMATPEEDKKSFLASFSADREAFEKIRVEFEAFLKRVEQIAAGSRPEHAYQLNFDLLRWF